MRVKRIGYIGVRTPQMDRMTWFFREVLGLSAGHTDGSYSVSRLPSGKFDFAEAYSPQLRDPRMIPNEVDGIVVSFIVDDLEGALAEVRQAGLEIVGDLVWAAKAFDEPAFEGVGWFWVRAPDGRVYVIEQSVD